MKRFARILAISAVLCTLLFLNFVVFKVGSSSTAHACGKYAVNYSEVQFSNGGNQPVGGHFALWYNSCNGQNYTEVDTTSSSRDTNMSVEVCRNSGPDGGALCSGSTYCLNHEPGICDSAGVYSPHNTAYAILYTSATILTGSSF
jgi:hypothetical protein